MMAFQSIYGRQKDVQDLMLYGLEVNEVNSMKMDDLHSLYRRLSIDYGISQRDGARKLLATSAGTKSDFTVSKLCAAVLLGGCALDVVALYAT
jgi:hypothetical protein